MKMYHYFHLKCNCLVLQLQCAQSDASGLVDNLDQDKTTGIQNQSDCGLHSILKPLCLIP